MEIDYFNFDQCKQNFKYLSHLNKECFVSFLAKHLLLDFYADSRKINTNKAFAFEYDIFPWNEPRIQIRHSGIYIYI